MQKVLLALALVLALSNGQYILNNIVEFNSDYYDIDIDLTADIGYMTMYMAGQGAAVTTNPVGAVATVYEQYSLRFYSLVTLNIAQNFGQVYSQQITFFFYPFIADPIQVKVAVSRFD